MRKSYRDRFPGKTVVGMVHLQALPGAPRYGGNVQSVYDAALYDLRALERGGVHAAIIENFGDLPYGTDNPFITLASMTAIAAGLRRETGLQLGLNVQFNCTAEEWGMAYAVGADFIRVEAFVEMRAGMHGVTGPSAPALTRERARYPKDILLLCDIATKHTYPLTEQPIDFSIHEAIASGADALIVTGVITGQNPTLEQVREFKRMAGDFPVIIGSGVKKENVAEFFEVADGAIVGTSFKVGGDAFAPIDPDRVRAFMGAF